MIGDWLGEKMKLKRLRTGAVLPHRATKGSAGYDLYACIDDPVTVGPGETVKLPTGWAMEIPSGYVGYIFARSSMGAKYGVVPANGVGVIDSDYRGEVSVLLFNHSHTLHTIQPGDRVAQLVISPVLTPILEEAAALTDTQRGSGGFGSTSR